MDVNSPLVLKIVCYLNIDNVIATIFTNFPFAAAVSSLAKFGAHCEELLPSIVVLLER